MKIRAILMTEEEKKKYLEEFIQDHPGAPENLVNEFKKGLAGEKYVELETGREFENLPPKAQELMEKGISAMMKAFACNLLAAINYDQAAAAYGVPKMGLEAIRAGIKEIERGLELAEAMINDRNVDRPVNPNYS